MVELTWKGRCEGDVGSRDCEGGEEVGVRRPLSNTMPFGWMHIAVVMVTSSILLLYLLPVHQMMPAF